MSKVALTIEYAGMQLQIVKNADGEEVTPLKPISDLFGLKWEVQRKKVTENDFYREYFGTCTPSCGGAGGQKREQVCILLSRVAAFMMTISPAMVSAKGNISGANFLKEKLNEWADAIHDYEVVGIAINKKMLTAEKLELARINTFARLIATKNKSGAKHDRQALEAAQKVIAKELGIPYQADLVDGA